MKGKKGYMQVEGRASEEGKKCEGKERKLTVTNIEGNGRNRYGG